MNIPDKAVEAAAKELYAEARSTTDGFDMWPEWEHAPEIGRGAFRDEARAALKAAAPFIAAQAWDDGYEAGANDGDPLIQIRLAKGEDIAAKNPHTNHAQINDEPPCEWCGWCRDCTRDPERPANNGEVNT